MLKNKKSSRQYIKTVSKHIRIKQVIAEGKEWHVVRGEISIPDSILEIKKIISTNYLLQINNTEIFDGKVVLDGNITVQVICLTEKNDTQRFLGNISYHDFIDVPGAVTGMTATVSSEIKNINLTNYNNRQRTVTVGIIIDTLARASDVKEIPVITDAPPQWRPQKENINFNQILTSKKVEFDKKEKIKISNSYPPVQKVIAYRVRPLVENYNLATGSAHINGWLQVEIDYLDLSNNRQYIQRFIPFKKLAALPEARKEFIAEVNVLCHEAQITTTLDKNEFIFLVHVELLVQVSKPECLEAVTRLNSCNVEATINEVLTENIVDVKNVEAIIYDQCLSLNNSNNYLVRDVRVGPITTVQTGLLKEKVLMRGCAGFIIELTDKEHKYLKSIYRRVQFKSIAAMNKSVGDSRIEIIPVVEFAKCFFENEKLTISAVLHIIVRMLDLNRCSLVSDAKEIKKSINEKVEVALFTYKLQKEDSLEQLANRFGTSIEAIEKANSDVDVHRATWGCEILIPCQVEK